MKILPSEKIEIISTLPIQQVRDNIYKNIRPKRDFLSNFKNPKDDKVFEGRILEDTFEVQLIINMNNSFLPQIIGKLQSIPQGTKITADLKIHEFVKTFMIIFFSGVSFALIMIVFGVITVGINPFYILIPILFYVFGFGLVNFAFNMEKENSIKGLERIIKDEKVKFIDYRKYKNSD